MAGHGPSVSKAKKILSDDQVKGKSLSMAQRRFFGARAGGKKKNVGSKTR